MKKIKYQSDFGATTACVLRMAEGFEDDSECGTIVMGDAWFGSVRAVTQLAKRSMDSIFQVKSNHGLFPKDFIEEALKDGPGGTHIVLTAQDKFENDLVAIGYRYNSKVTLCFVMSKNAGATTNGTPYEMKFTDSHGNVHVRLVDRPDVISEFFQHSNGVDKHNQVRQYELALEKKWDTRDPYFRLITTLIGINVVDTWKLSLHHTLFSRLQMKHNAEATMTISTFTGILTKQLIKKAHNVMKTLASSAIHITNIDKTTNQEEISEISCSLLQTPTKERTPCVKFYPAVTNKQGKKYKKSRRCVVCGSLTTAYCGCCNKAHCYAVREGRKKNTRTCLVDHLHEMKNNSRKRTRTR